MYRIDGKSDVMAYYISREGGSVAAGCVSVSEPTTPRVVTQFLSVSLHAFQSLGRGRALVLQCHLPLSTHSSLNLY